MVDAKRLIDHLHDPAALEALHRESPRAFRRALTEARGIQPDALVFRVWEARFMDLPGSALPAAPLQVIAVALACALLVRVPALWLGGDWYYPRFAPSIVILALVCHFWLEQRHRRHLIAATALAVVAGTFAALLPGDSDSVVMALIHLPILFWVLLGVVHAGPSWRETEPRIRFLRYNGELLIIGSLLALGGVVFSGITIALFGRVSAGTEDWYVANVGVMGAAALPVAGTYLHQAVFHGRTGMASVLVRVFAPLFLVMTGVYLLTVLLGGQNPFIDRSILITVNGLLLVVLGMAVLSVAERGNDDGASWVDRVNLALLAMTLIIDLLALAAILFRLSTFGFTPNRVVVLGANLVILAHLAIVCRAHLGLVRGTADRNGIRRAATCFLPVYAAWAAMVCFVLPLIFRFS